MTFGLLKKQLVSNNRFISNVKTQELENSTFFVKMVNYAPYITICNTLAVHKYLEIVPYNSEIQK